MLIKYDNVEKGILIFDDNLKVGTNSYIRTMILNVP
jgi:hypothetical protein